MPSCGCSPSLPNRVNVVVPIKNKTLPKLLTFEVGDIDVVPHPKDNGGDLVSAIPMKNCTDFVDSFVRFLGL